MLLVNCYVDFLHYVDIIYEQTPPMHVDVETIIQPTTSQNIEPQILDNIPETLILEQVLEQQIELSQENPLSDLDASTIFNIEHNTLIPHFHRNSTSRFPTYRI
jgi:hypothetical protein